MNQHHYCAIVASIVGIIFLSGGVISALVADDVGYCLEPENLQSSIIPFTCAVGQVCDSCEWCQDHPQCESIVEMEATVNSTCCMTNLAQVEHREQPLWSGLDGMSNMEYAEEHSDELDCGNSEYDITCRTMTGTCYYAEMSYEVYVNGYLKSGDRSGMEKINCGRNESCAYSWFEKWDDGEYKIRVANWFWKEDIGMDARPNCESGHGDQPSGKTGPSENAFSGFVALSFFCFFAAIYVFTCVYGEWTEGNRLDRQFRNSIINGNNGVTRFGNTEVELGLSRNYEETKFEGETQVCSICLMGLEPGETVYQMNKCGHRYHPKCLTDWHLEKPKHCPECGQVPP